MISFDRSLVTRALSLFVMLALGLGAIGCNTTEGIGEDVEATGDAMKDAARDAKD